MKILIDNGHGQSTPGKRSPDGRFLEFLFNRKTNRKDVEFLQSRAGKQAIVDLHVDLDRSTPPLANSPASSSPSQPHQTPATLGLLFYYLTLYQYVS